MCTVNSLLPCVSSDNELKFRCEVLQFGSLSFITWNPSTLRFHKKKKQTNKQDKTTTKTKTLKWRMIIAVIYTTFTAGKRKPEKNSGLYGIRTLDLCDTGAPVSQRSRERIPYEPEFFFRLFFRNCKGCVYNCHYHPSFKCFCFVVVVVLFVCFFTETVMCWGFT